MSGETTKPGSIRLNVLPSSGKIDQLRSEFAMQNEISAEAAPATPLTDFASTMGATANNEASPPTPSSPPSDCAPKPFDPIASIQNKLLEGKIIAALKTVYDPEIPIDIYELGLIYAIEIDAEKNVNVRMTLTAPGCPVAGSLPGEVERRVESVAEVKSATVELVWEPAWSKDRMSEAAMLQLGIY